MMEKRKNKQRFTFLVQNTMKKDIFLIKVFFSKKNMENLY